MTEEERSRIVSQDYADIIINYINNPQFLEQIPNATVQIMNVGYAVAYLPVAQALARGTRSYGFATWPYLFGLTSEVALEASGVTELRTYPDFNLRGQGVLVGIVDTGVNYNLSAFKKEDGTTKLLSLWDQTIQNGPFPYDYGFGTEYTQEEINQALQEETPLNVVPSTDTNGHGTMLAGIAVGAEDSPSEFTGVAPDAELVVVKLMDAKNYLRDFYGIPEGVVCYQENSIMWGVQYCLQVARDLNRPIAVALALGNSLDAHDGRSALSNFLSVVADFPRVAIVTSIGNEGNRGRHFHGNIDPASQTSTVEMNVGETDRNFTMVLWGNSPGIFSIDILSPSGEYIPRIPAGLHVSRQISFIFEETDINIDYQTVESFTGDQLIMFRFHNTSAGIWRFTVYGQGDLVSSFNIWLPMGDMISADTYFVQPDIYTTILSPGSAEIPITVTAYNAISGTLYVSASRGYTRSDVVKPDFAAPGVNYVAPDLNGGYVNFTGTGVASAHTTGVAALMLEWGAILGNQPTLNTTEIKKYLIRGARRSTTLVYPNRDWGYGVLDIYNAFSALRINL